MSSCYSRACSSGATRLSLRSADGDVRRPPNTSNGSRATEVSVTSAPLFSQSGFYIHPRGMGGHLVGMLLLLSPSLVSGDVQEDVRMTTVLRGRRGDYGSASSAGVLRRQHCPPVELFRRFSVPSPLPGPRCQFMDRRMIHPIDRDRFGILVLQKNMHINLALARTTTPLSGEDAPAKVLLGVDLRRWCHSLVEVAWALHADARLRRSRNTRKKHHGGCI